MGNTPRKFGPTDRAADMIVDPWAAAKLPRPNDAPPIYTSPMVGIGQIPLIKVADLVAYVAIMVTGLNEIIEEIFVADPRLAKKIGRRVNDLAAMRTVAGEPVRAEGSE
jgi:hypothetical protein